MTGVQVFLMAFGAVLAVIGVIVFFLLAWFKETTGQDHDNAIKILQAEFRFSNPALVIFAGGLLLMVAPFFLGQSGGEEPPLPTPQSPPLAATATPAVPMNEGPTLFPAANPGPTMDFQAGVETPTATPLPPPTPTEPLPAPTPTLVPPTLIPTPTLLPVPTPTPPPPMPMATDIPSTPALGPPDPTGRWVNQTGSLEFRSLGTNAFGVNEFAYLDYDNFGNQVGQGSAIQYEDTLQVSGQGFLLDAFGNPYHVVYTGYMVLEGDVMAGDLYDASGSIYLGSVRFNREESGSGK